MPFLTHNMARPPTDFCAACLPGYRRCKIPDATLSGSTIFLSVEASTRANGLFLPHIMAANRLRKHQGKKGKKGHARLCDSTVCAFVLCFPRLRKDLRHIIWLESADNHVKPQKIVLIEMRDDQMLLQAELYQGQAEVESPPAKQKKQLFEHVVATVTNCFNENFSEETSP